MKELRGKVAVVTGASKGLGVHIARALAARGVNLVLAARSADGLQEVCRAAEGLGVRAIAVPVDLSLPRSLDHLIQRAEATFGRVDILINNAGLLHTSDYANIDPELIEETMRVNLRAPMLLTRRVLPGMIARGEGHIVNMSSVGGLGGAPYSECYTATKHALVGFTRSLRLTFQAQGHPIGASVVCPGFVPETGMFHDSMRETGAEMPARFGSTSAEQVAHAVITAIVRNDAEVIVNSLPVRPVLLLMLLFPWLSEHVARATGIGQACRQMVQGKKRSARPLSGQAPLS
jgi:short-subunit dehydrogenase